MTAPQVMLLTAATMLSAAVEPAGMVPTAHLPVAALNTPWLALKLL